MKYSRRKFISAVGKGSALLMLPSVSLFSNQIFSQQDKKLGIALVGLGGYATRQLAPALQETKHCHLSGIVTGTPDKAVKWKREYNIPDENIYNYENFDRIADNKSIDIVYVVLPNSMHHEFTIRAAKAGKHVICEKPMGVSVKECEEMIDACKQAGVRLFVGYRLHFDPFHKTAMNFRNDGHGKIKMVHSEFAFKIGDPNQWRLKKDLAGGGAMMDLGIYAVQAARYSTGEEPISVTAQEYKTDPVKFKEVDETIYWQMEFPGGAASTSVTSYAAPANRLYIGAEEGWLELRPAYSYRGIKGSTNEGNLIMPEVNQQALQMDGMAKCIMDRCKSDADGEEGLKDLKVIEAIYKSIANKGRAVKV
ncbi:MAG: Gfo/Idh/MocA family oxidoreductase [Ignavibacteriaceae bacterium]